MSRRSRRRGFPEDYANPLREEGEDEDGSPPITEHQNELIRTSITKGQSLLQMLDDDLEAAWSAWLDASEVNGNGKTPVIRGRVRGLAQAIATIKSPFSRQNMGGNSRGWAEQIKRVEDESLATVRAKRRAENRKA